MRDIRRISARASVMRVSSNFTVTNNNRFEIISRGRDFVVVFFFLYRRPSINANYPGAVVSIGSSTPLGRQSLNRNVRDGRRTNNLEDRRISECSTRSQSRTDYTGKRVWDSRGFSAIRVDEIVVIVTVTGEREMEGHRHLSTKRHLARHWRHDRLGVKSIDTYAR